MAHFKKKCVFICTTHHDTAANRI